MKKLYAEKLMDRASEEVVGSRQKWRCNISVWLSGGHVNVQTVLCEALRLPGCQRLASMAVGMQTMVYHLPTSA